MTKRVKLQDHVVLTAVSTFSTLGLTMKFIGVASIGVLYTKVGYIVSLRLRSAMCGERPRVRELILYKSQSLELVISFQSVQTSMILIK